MAKTPDQNDTAMKDFANAEPKGFGLFLTQLEDGRLQSDATTRLAELCTELSRQADATGGKVKGSFTLKIKMTAERGGVVDIDSDIVIVKPKPPRLRSVMWLNARGALSNENPKQMHLGLRDVSGPPQGEARDVVGKKGTGE